jgi:hypothetical protein
MVLKKELFIGETTIASNSTTIASNPTTIASNPTIPASNPTTPASVAEETNREKALRIVKDNTNIIWVWLFFTIQLFLCIVNIGGIFAVYKAMDDSAKVPQFYVISGIICVLVITGLDFGVAYSIHLLNEDNDYESDFIKLDTVGWTIMACSMILLHTAVSVLLGLPIEGWSTIGLLGHLITGAIWYHLLRLKYENNL